MGSVTGTESDSTLKMRLAPILALVILSCLLLNLTSAQRSASRKTAKNCRGSSSRPSSSRSSSSRGSTRGRGSARCPPNVKPTTRTTSKATSSTTSNNLKPTRRTTKKLPTKKSRGKTTRTSSRPSSSTTSSETSGSTRKPRLPTKRSKLNKTKTSGTSDSSVPPTNEEGDSVPGTNEEGDSVPAIVEERDSVSTSKRIKAAAKKYLGKVKDKLQSAAIWFVENKDKTIDDILVDKWKKKCPGGASTKKKRKQCVSDALAESDDDTPEEKLVKDALKSLLEDDSDEAYEFLSTSSSKTFGEIENVEETQDISTSENSNSSRNSIRKRLPTKRSKVISTSGNSGSSGNKLRKFNLPKKKKKQTSSPDSPTDAETDSGSSTRRKIKTSAKKSLQKVKDKLKVAAVWYLENKDKTIDDILVDKWKEKCPGGISTKKKRKQCVSDALADSDDDTPEEKEMKDALKSLVEEDSDGAYDFLSTSSSRTFGDIENEEEIQDKLSEMPEKYEKLWEEDKSKTFTELESEFEREKAEKMSKLSNNMKAVFSKVGGQISTKIRSWSRSCTKKSRTTQSRKCQNEAGGSGQKKQKCREAQSARRRSCLEEVFEPTPEDSLQDRNIKAELEELAVQDPETGTQLVESCQIPETIRSKRSPGSGGLGPAASCLAVRGVRPRNRNTDQRTVFGKVVFGNIFRNVKAAAAPFLSSLNPTYTTIDPPKSTKDFIDLLGKAKINGISKGKPVALNDENNFFVNDDIVLGTGPLPPNFDPRRFYHDSEKHVNDVSTGYQEYESEDDFEYLQVDWIQDRDPVSGNIIFENGHEKGHFEVTPMEGKITIGVMPGPPEKVTRLVPAIGVEQRAIGNTLRGNDPFTHVGPIASNINKGRGAL